MPDSTVADLDDLIAASKAVKKTFEPDVYLNLAFYAGRQWTAWDGNQVFTPALDPTRELVTDNRIQPAVRTEIAKMTKTKPKWVGVPRTQSDEDIAGARYAELALDDVWKTKDGARKLRNALLWSRCGRAGFLKFWWDTEVGPHKDILVHPADHAQAGQPLKNKRGAFLSPDQLPDLPEGTTADPKAVHMGDICMEVRSFFQMYPDPLCAEEGLEAAEWCGEESVFSRKFCEKHFPDKAMSLTYDADPSAGNVEARIPGAYTATTTDAGKGVKLREYWSGDKHVIWTPGGRILLEEDNPYPWLPYVMFRGIPVPGQFWPDCIVSQLRPRQVDFNKRLSDIANNAERISNPPLLVPSSMGEDFVWQGLPGERIDYQDTGSAQAMPSFMEVPEIPAYVQNDVDRIEKSFMEISGQHEVTGASVPAGVTAASAISQLQEADDTRLGPDVADMEEALANAGRRILWMVKNLYTDERHLKVSGEAGRWDVLAFKGDMANGCEDIEVQAGSGMPESRAGKQAAIQQMATLFAQSQQPISPRDWRKILSEFQVGGLEAFFAHVERDEQQVSDENRRLANGEQLQINSYDDDAAHIEYHTDFQKTSRYQVLDPLVKKNFEDHLFEHRTRIAPVPQAPPPDPSTLGPPPDPSTNGATPPVPSSPAPQ